MLPDNLAMGAYRELKPHEVKLLFDKSAAKNAVINRINRMLSSGRSAGGERTRSKRWFK
jgi:hypothetical protein